ncbi:MAG: hypothetical protein QM766_16480 [Burkholderiaceae bacterium]
MKSQRAPGQAVRRTAKEKNVIPHTYDQWRECITVDCGLELTPAFIVQRLAVWRNPQSDETQRFRRLYGDEHWQSVLAWFERAEREAAR